MASRQGPTERDRFWLDHERTISKSGQSAKAYAAEQGLSLHALYQARKRLKALGHLPNGKIAPDRKQRTKPGAGVAFSKIELVFDDQDARTWISHGLLSSWWFQEAGRVEGPWHL